MREEEALRVLLRSKSKAVEDLPVLHAAKPAEFPTSFPRKINFFRVVMVVPVVTLFASLLAPRRSEACEHILHFFHFLPEIPTLLLTLTNTKLAPYFHTTIESVGALGKKEGEIC